ncbi:unnamed protein product [Phytophthora fragariaefolia]|uniref:Unnamed protein product n=1 Tax=Phytophthora fragariaefolia TaxID=1490495 RepID=A0A9W6WZP6_9STRA|nr:unnamed protein product [Phytophthora fragariaefolia]
MRGRLFVLTMGSTDRKLPGNGQGRRHGPVGALHRYVNAYKLVSIVTSVDKQNKTFAVRITKCKLEHNHSLTEVGFKSHPLNRISLDASGLKTVDELRKAGAKKISLLKFIKDNSSSNPMAQDVQNLVRKLKAGENEQGRSSSAKRLKKWMTDFGEIPGNVGRIFVDDVAGKVRGMHV